MLKINSSLENSPGYFFWHKNSKIDMENALKPTAIELYVNLIKFTMRRISVKERCGTIPE